MPLTQTEIDELKRRVAAMRAQKTSPQASARHVALPRLPDEFNALDDPGDQTLWWRANYEQIKRAQQRQRYAEAMGRQAT